jgi:hypothetical protein
LIVPLSVADVVVTLLAADADTSGVTDDVVKLCTGEPVVLATEFVAMAS